MPIAVAQAIAMLPSAIAVVQALGKIVADAQAAGRSESTAQEAQALATAMSNLASANASFNAQFADVLPKS